MDTEKIKVTMSDGDDVEGRVVVIMAVGEGNLTTKIKGKGSLVDLLAMYGRFRMLIDEDMKNRGIDPEIREMLLDSAEDAAEEAFGEKKPSDEEALIALLKGLIG